MKERERVSQMIEKLIKLTKTGDVLWHRDDECNEFNIRDQTFSLKLRQVPNNHIGFYLSPQVTVAGWVEVLETTSFIHHRLPVLWKAIEQYQKEANEKQATELIDDFLGKSYTDGRTTLRLDAQDLDTLKELIRIAQKGYVDFEDEEDSVTGEMVDPIERLDLAVERARKESLDTV